MTTAINPLVVSCLLCPQPFDVIHKTVGKVAAPCSAQNTIGPGADSVQALVLMGKHNASRLLVAEGGHLVGIIILKDLMKFLALKKMVKTRGT